MFKVAQALRDYDAIMMDRQQRLECIIRNKMLETGESKKLYETIQTDGLEAEGGFSFEMDNTEPMIFLSKNLNKEAVLEVFTYQNETYAVVASLCLADNNTIFRCYWMIRSRHNK